MTLQVISEGPAAEEAAERFVVRSERMGRDFQVTVTPPFATPFAPEQAFPAIVALDNGYEFAGPMARLLEMAGATAPAFVIALWYPPGQEHHRNTDLLHEPWKPLHLPSFGGGGAIFEAFLMGDLLPFFVSRYLIDRHRMALFGHSAGGLFAANVLADRPDAFSGHVIVSAPADAALADRLEAGLADATGKRVYLAVGSHEDAFRLQREETVYLTGFARLDAALRRSPGVECVSRIYANENHLSVIGRVLPDALPFVLPPRRAPTAPLPRSGAAMDGRLGVYALAAGGKVAISFEQGLPRAMLADHPKAPLMHVRQDLYYCPTFDLDFAFDGAGLTLSGGGVHWRGERVEAG